MPGYNHVFQRVLIRQAIANSQGEHDRAGQLLYLNAMLTALFQQSKDGEMNLASSTINGKSVSFNTPPGMTRTDVMMAVEGAIECIEHCLHGPVNMAYGRASWP